MKLKPLENRVLLKQKKAEEKTQGGIWLPPVAQTKTQIGTIIEVGESKLQIGQEVVYDKFAGVLINIDEEEHVLILDVDVLAIVIPSESVN
jgi:chaperonin GroES